MKNYRNWIIAVNLLAIIAYFSYTVIEKERTLRHGKLILLALAPVDPRSLMQGDYMRLRYSIADSIDLHTAAPRGYLVVRLNEQGIAKGIRIQDDALPLNKDEILLKYTLSNRNVLNIGAESYFFQEGHAVKYEHAKFGGLRVDEKGNSLLIGLYNEKEKFIE